MASRISNNTHSHLNSFNETRMSILEIEREQLSIESKRFKLENQKFKLIK